MGLPVWTLPAMQALVAAAMSGAGPHGPLNPEGQPWEQPSPQLGFYPLLKQCPSLCPQPFKGFSGCLCHHDIPPHDPRARPVPHLSAVSL